MAQRKRTGAHRATKRKRTERYGQGTPGVMAAASQNDMAGQLSDQPNPVRKTKRRTQPKVNSH